MGVGGAGRGEGEREREGRRGPGGAEGGQVLGQLACQHLHNTELHIKQSLLQAGLLPAASCRLFQAATRVRHRPARHSAGAWQHA